MKYKTGDKVIVLDSAKEVNYSGPLNSVVTVIEIRAGGKFDRLHFKETEQCCHANHVKLYAPTKLEKALL